MVPENRLWFYSHRLRDEKTFKCVLFLSLKDETSHVIVDKSCHMLCETMGICTLQHSNIIIDDPLGDEAQALNTVLMSPDTTNDCRILKNYFTMYYKWQCIRHIAGDNVPEYCSHHVRSLQCSQGSGTTVKGQFQSPFTTTWMAQ